MLTDLLIAAAAITLTAVVVITARGWAYQWRHARHVLDITRAEARPGRSVSSPVLLPVGSMILAEEQAIRIDPAGFLRGLDDVLSAGTVTGDWGRCSNPPEESCSDAACPVHGYPDDHPFTVITKIHHEPGGGGQAEAEGWTPELLAELRGDDDDWPRTSAPPGQGRPDAARVTGDGRQMRMAALPAPPPDQDTGGGGPGAEAERLAHEWDQAPASITYESVTSWAARIRADVAGWKNEPWATRAPWETITEGFMPVTGENC